MSSPTRLYLLRHAEVEERYHRVFGGRIDMELSAHGHRQAQSLAAHLQRVSFDAIYASPMKRAQQTLAQLIAQRSLTAVVLDELREVDFGSWTGLTWDEVRERFQTSPFRWLDQLEQGLIRDAEPASGFRERVDAGLRKMLSAQPEKAIAVVCHGGVIRMLLAILLDLPLQKMAVFEIDYASVTVVQHGPSKTEVQLLNFSPWRDGA